jgi:hypothetical protein
MGFPARDAEGSPVLPITVSSMEYEGSGKERSCSRIIRLLVHPFAYMRTLVYMRLLKQFNHKPHQLVVPICPF